jgi:hypothetical protein
VRLLLLLLLHRHRHHRLALLLSTTTTTTPVLTRMIPIQATCFASLDEIQATPLIQNLVSENNNNASQQRQASPPCPSWSWRR